MGHVLTFFSENLIPFMGAMLLCALVFRWFAYRHSKQEGAYFSTFIREVQKNIEKDKEDNVEIKSVESYLNELLGRVSKKLPNRNVRMNSVSQNESEDETPGGQREMVSLKEFISSKEGLVASIQSEASVFNTKSPPNFTELTYRILDQDKNWSRLLKIFPIEGVGRMIDILPSLFIVFGVLGTFMGISMALPEIANIDFNDLDASQETLTRFVLNVTFAMKTSIAGIVFSLILTFLNTMFPIKAVRNRIFRKVETCFQSMWYHMQNDDQNNTEEKILLQILETLKEMKPGSNMKAG